MPLDTHSPRPERPLKRSFDSDCEGAAPNKRQHLPLTPPILDHHLDKLHRPSRPQSIDPTLPETAEPCLRPFWDFEPACDPANIRRIDD